MTLVSYCQKHDRLYETARCPECRSALVRDVIVVVLVSIAVAVATVSMLLPAAALLEGQ